MKTICILFILSGLIFGCHLNSKDNSDQNTAVGAVPYDEKTDSVVKSLIARLPEFKNLELRFQKRFDGSHHLALWVDRNPDSKFKFYEILAGDDNEWRYETMYNFYVNLKDSSVFFHDTISDSVLTISQWRKSGKDNLWRP